MTTKAPVVTAVTSSTTSVLTTTAAVTTSAAAAVTSSATASTGARPKQPMTAVTGQTSTATISGGRFGCKLSPNSANDHSAALSNGN